jgi:hypothetical protein
MDELFNPALTLFATDKQIIKSATTESTISTTTSFSASSSLLSADLPVNVQLVTLESTRSNELLVRLGHAFAVDEDDVLSAPVEVDLFALLSKYHPVSAQEMTLSAAQLLSEQLAEKIDWTASGTTTTSTSKIAPAVKKSLRKAAASVETSYLVTLNAMQIKTFKVQLAK